MRAVIPSNAAKVRNLETVRGPGNTGFGKKEATGGAKFASRTDAIGATSVVYLAMGIGLYPEVAKGFALRGAWVIIAAKSSGRASRAGT